MIVFGAGASYDSDPDHPSTDTHDPVRPSSRPPLAANLFDPRFAPHLDKHTAVRGVMTSLRQSNESGVSIERRLQELLEQSEHRPQVARQLMEMRWYLQDVIIGATRSWHNQHHGATCYAALLDQVQRWSQDNSEEVVLVTFNYDGMLDDAFATQVVSVLATMDDYIADPGFKLVKVHGSTNWTRRFVSHADHPQATSPLWIGERVHPTDEFALNRSISREDARTWWLPAIAIPTIRKSEFECPSSHVHVLRHAMNHLSSLVIIGWAAAEDHFFNVWKDSVAQPSPGSAFPPNLYDVHIVDRDETSAQNVVRRLAAEGIRLGGSSTAYAGFADFVRSDSIRHVGSGRR